MEEMLSPEKSLPQKADLSIAFLRSNHQDALMSVNQMNWYFMLYVFGYIAIALGILNLWIYRKEIWNIVFGKDDDDDIKE